MNENKQQNKACTICYIALTLLLILIVICGILTLLGPQIGNVFSQIGDCACLPANSSNLIIPLHTAV